MALTTTIPKLTGLLDEIALMKSISLIIADDARLALVPVLPKIKFLQDAQLLEDIVWQLPRSAFTLTADGWTVNTDVTHGQPVGAGIIIEMPEMDTESPKVSGTPAKWLVPIVGLMEVNTNFLPGVGIGITASQLCQIALDICQNLYVFGYGTFNPVTSAIKPAEDWTSLKPGIEAYRLTLEGTVGRVQTKRSAIVLPTFDAGVCTLTCADGAAEVLYTTDFTEPVQTNPGVQIYSGPFNVASGTIVKCSSKKAGLILSPINGATAP